jgi:predicted site-specific integrase-resolvase
VGIERMIRMNDIKNEEHILLSDVLSIPEASEQYGISVDIIKRNAREGKFFPAEARKMGKNWIITKQGIERVFVQSKKAPSN